MLSFFDLRLTKNRQSILINHFFDLIFDIFFGMLNAGFALLRLAFRFVGSISGNFTGCFLRLTLNVLAGGFSPILNAHGLFLCFLIFPFHNVTTGFGDIIRQEVHFTLAAPSHGVVDELLRSSPTLTR